MTKISFVRDAQRYCILRGMLVLHCEFRKGVTCNPTHRGLNPAADCSLESAHVHHDTHSRSRLQKCVSTPAALDFISVMAGWVLKMSTVQPAELRGSLCCAPSLLVPQIRS